MNPTNSIPETTLPVRREGAVTPERLCWMLRVKHLDQIYRLAEVLRAGSLNLYTVLVKRADENGRLQIKMHELMSEAGMNNTGTFYKHERWLMNLGLLEKQSRAGQPGGSQYCVYALESLPIQTKFIEEFERYLLTFGEWM